MNNFHSSVGKSTINLPVRRDYLNYSPSLARRTKTTAVPISRLDNSINMDESRSSGMPHYGSMSGRYVDTYRPWTRPSQNVAHNYECNRRLFSPNRARDYSGTRCDALNATPNCKLNYSNYLTTRPIDITKTADAKAQRTTTCDLAKLTLNESETEEANPVAYSSPRRSRFSSGCKGGDSQSIEAAAKLDITEKSLDDGRRDYSPAERHDSLDSSNSSNNSSAPRLSNSTRASPSSTILAKTQTASQGCHQNGGLVGLNNLGNTCFMNSIIQCLSNTHLLLDYCLSGRYASDLNKSSSMHGNLFNAYVSLMKELWDPDLFESSTSPMQFKTQIQRFAPRFVGYSQQDSQEFLRYVLEGLHMEVNRVSKRPRPVTPDYATEDKLPDREKAELYWKRYLSMDNSEIVDLFVGQLMSTLECSECGFKSTTFDPFWDLSLPIPKKNNVNIVDCLRLFTSKEDLEGNERPVCARCKTRRRCTKHFSIQKFPRILVLHLKRFSGERFRSKMSVLVDFPLNDLNLSEFASPSCQQRSVRYNLYAVSNHSGSVYAGHYTASCRHHYRNSWYDYNDSRVHPINAQSVVSAEGYVLFYELAG